MIITNKLNKKEYKKVLVKKIILRKLVKDSLLVKNEELTTLNELNETFHFNYKKIKLNIEEYRTLLRLVQNFNIQTIANQYRRKVKLLINNTAIIWDPVLKDFLLRLVMPNKKYLIFNTNFSWGPQKINDFSKIYFSNYNIYNNNSFFNSYLGLTQRNLIFHFKYKKRTRQLERMNLNLLVNKLNKKNAYFSFFHLWTKINNLEDFQKFVFASNIQRRRCKKVNNIKYKKHKYSSKNRVKHMNKFVKEYKKEFLKVNLEVFYKRQYYKKKKYKRIYLKGHRKCVNFSRVLHKIKEFNSIYPFSRNYKQKSKYGRILGFKLIYNSLLSV
jgi:hypothetical protein